ncbi:MAG: YHS domain-containing protein [Planctomycetes bacterium]|nr:YHS domain-containing protein [Planctomycetota bacterium]
MNPLRVALVLAAVTLAAGVLVAGCEKVEKPASPPAAAPAAAAPAPAIAIAQKTCPVMGGPIDPKMFTEYKGRRIYFCCAACIEKFKADPAKYIAKVDAELKGAAAPAAPATAPAAPADPATTPAAEPAGTK